jgi:hypothetical protein
MEKTATTQESDVVRVTSYACAAYCVGAGFKVKQIEPASGGLPVFVFAATAEGAAFDSMRDAIRAYARWRDEMRSLQHALGIWF